MQSPSPWNSLEIVKIIVDVLTPLVLLALGYWISRLTHRLESTQWANQKITEKRIAIYDELAPMLNDLYCYYCFVGNWKELTPPEVIDIKRKLDKRTFIYSHLFSTEFLTLYNAFIQECFQPYSGWNHDARLRASIISSRGNRREATRLPWQEAWNEYFVPPESATDRSKIQQSYRLFMSCFARELGVGLKP